MTTIAELGIKVDSGDAAQAATDLDKLAAAGARAEKAADGVSSGFDKATSAASGLSSAEGKLNETTDQAIARLTAMAKASLDSSEYYQRLTTSVTGNTAAVDASSSSASSLAALRRRLQADSDALVGSTDQLAESTKKAAAATGIEAEGLQALLGKINPTLTALGKLDEQQAQLQKYKNAGLIDADTFKEYSTRIDASRQKLGEFGESVKSAGVSTAQTQAALRQLPAQFSDIFTSLAGGQNPLLVLIQQGGQIKDSFGGIGPTLDVLGGKIKSILGIGGTVGAVGEAFESVGTGAKAAADGAEAAGAGLGAMAEGANTAADASKNAKEAADALRAAGAGVSSGLGAILVGASAAAAALAALIYGYSQGSKESDEYNKSLILTGNYAGTSAYQLADLAKQVSATNGTIGEAAASLSKMAASGAIASTSFKVIADAAASMEDATGKSVDSTIAEFVKIAKDPVAAAKTLNEQYHFLTASVYSQITALKEQGDTIGAAKLLTDTYAKTIEDRAGQISLNLGIIEKGWKGIKDAAKGALDATLGIGRQETLGDQISALETKLANPGSYASIPVIGADNPDMMEVGSTKSQDEERLRVLKLYNQEQVLTTKLTGERQRAQEASILSQDKLNASLKATDSNQKKLKDRLKEIDDLAKKSSEAQGGRVYTSAELEQLREAARKQFKDPAASSKSVDLTAFNDAQNQLKSITGYYDGIQKELDASQKAGLVSAESYASQRAAIIEQQKGDVTSANEAEIAALEAAKGKASTSAEQRIQLDQKIADARTSMVEAQKKADSELSVLATSETGRLKKQTASLKSYTDALELQTAALAKAGQRAALGVGRGDRENAFSSELNAQDDRYANSSRELANQRGEAGLRGASKADLDAEFGPKEAALAAQNEAATKQIQQNYQDLTAAQGDWRNGASSAFKNYLESARDVAGQTKSLFTNAFDSMDASLANFVISGKFSFSDFTKSILSDMAKIASRQASSALLGTLVGAATNYFSGSGTGNGLAAGSAGAVSSNVGASQSGYTSADFSSFVSGARATGGDVSPNSLYQVNELGPELLSQGGKTYLMTGEAGGSITPLASGNSSALGMRAVGGSGNAPNVYISIASDGTSQTSTDTSGLEQFGKQMGEIAAQKYRELESKSLSSQGNIRRAINGR